MRVHDAWRVAKPDLKIWRRQVVRGKEVCEGIDEHAHGALALLVRDELRAFPLVLAKREERSRFCS